MAIERYTTRTTAQYPYMVELEFNGQWYAVNGYTVELDAENRARDLAYEYPQYAVRIHHHLS